MKLLKDNWKRLLIIILFYLINFGLWELIAPTVSGEWASFIVYVVLFVVVLTVFHKELSEEWKDLKASQLKSKKFYLNLVAWLIADLVFTMLLLYVVEKFKLDILPKNNENVKAQMVSVPIALTVIQGCIFAPVIEEMTFRFSVIGKPKTRIGANVASVISIFLFDCIHIVRFPEFFYYLLPALVLTIFYTRYRNVFASIMLHSAINIVGYIGLIFGIL
ncbi:MAG: CPBP family intramembrane metalloprotease [Eubacterium sp.]|nr:CPBP family intramembrane metalloprotease [Eubacterium sp.]